MKKQKVFRTSQALLFLSALVIFIFVASSCQKDDDGNTGGPTTSPTYELKIVSGNNQTGEVKKALAQKLKVRLVNQNNEPQAGEWINFTQTSGGNFQDGKATDEQGIAAITWTLGTQKGLQRLEASADVEGNPSVEFVATGKLRDCLVEEKSFTPSAISYKPPHTAGGDTEYDGHGPKVDATARISISGNTIKATIYMKARETQANWTTAEGTKEVIIYTAPSNRKIEAILTDNASEASYVDTDHADDVITNGNASLVSKFVFTGDVVGADAGVNTKVVVHFNPIKIKLKEVGDCE